MRHFTLGLAAVMGSTICTLWSQPAGAMVPLSVSSRYSFHSDVGDHRVTNPGANFSLTSFDFVFGLRTFHSDEYKTRLEVDLPLRTLQSSSANGAPIGSEVGGYRITYQQTLWNFLGWDLSYADLNSNRLQLFAQNKSFETQVSLKTQNFLLPSVLMRALVGPGIRLSSGLLPMYSARAGFEAIWQNEFIGKLGLGLAANYRLRQNSSAGQGALFTLQPQFSWEVVDDLWLLVNYTRSLARPVGREFVMGDAGLGGLYGDVLSIGLATASF